MVEHAQSRFLRIVSSDPTHASVVWDRAEIFTLTRSSAREVCPDSYKMVVPPGPLSATYDANRDFQTMVSFGTPAVIALVLSGIRSCVCALPNARVDVASCRVDANVPIEAFLGNHGPLDLAAQSGIVLDIVKNSVSMLAIAAMNLVEKGVLYDPSDVRWSILEQRSTLGKAVGAIGLEDSRRAIYAHAFCGFDRTWVARLVTVNHSVIAGSLDSYTAGFLPVVPEPIRVVVASINGILLLDELRPAANNLVSNMHNRLKAIELSGKCSPLDWVENARGGICAENVKLIEAVVPQMAFLYGAIRQVVGDYPVPRGFEVLSDAFASHTAYIRKGAAWAATLPVPDAIAAANVEDFLGVESAVSFAGANALEDVVSVLGEGAGGAGSANALVHSVVVNLDGPAEDVEDDDAATTLAGDDDSDLSDNDSDDDPDVGYDSQPAEDL